MTTHLQEQPAVPFKSGEPPVLKITGITTVFKTRDGKVQAVKGVDLTLPKGKVLGLVGESGSGKSVTCYSITRLLPENAEIASGEILFWDRSQYVDLAALSEAQMRPYRGGRIAMIFQEPMSSLNPSMRCGLQVAEMLAAHTPLSKQQQKEKVLALFEEVSIPDPERAWQAFPHELSGGQLQRIMIAMAISCKPDILIADEPTTALDVTIQKDIIKLLKSLCKEYQMSMIFISHDLGVISEVADDVAVMQGGEIVEVGTLDQIMHHADHPYTKGLLASRPPTGYRLRRLPTVPQFLNDGGLTVEKFRAKHEVSTGDYQHRQDFIHKAPIILKVDHLSKRYVTKKDWLGRPKSWLDAVKDVSFSIRKGEIMGLVGESGCGKSTLGNMIMNLLKPSTGTVAFDGHDLFKLAGPSMRSLRKRMQIVFQDPYGSMNPRHSIGEIVTEPMHIHKIHGNATARRQKAAELLNCVGLDGDALSRYPHQFSGGQRQRICIARALATEPDFILLDESVSALDVSVQAQVLNLLHDLKDDFGLTYLLISHDLAVIKHFCDTVLVMEHGQIVEKNDAESVYHRPQHVYTQKLLASIPGRVD